MSYVPKTPKGDGAFGLLSCVAFAILTTLMFLYAAKRLSSDSLVAQFYRSQPCPGLKKEYFSWLRATMRSVTDTPQRVAEGYIKYGKANMPFLVPNIRKGPILVVPPLQLKAVLGMPEERVAAHIPQYENVSAKYTMRDPNIYPTNYEVDLVRKQVTKRFGSVTQELTEEVSLAFDEYWGTSDREWKTVRAWGSVQEIVARAVNRVTFGLPLCRNETFLRRSISYSMSVQRDGPAISLLPSFLKPVLGPLIAWKGKNDCEACIDLCLPLIEERLKFFYQAKSDTSSGWIPPNDIMQWCIEESYASQNPEQMNPRRIAHRLVMLNFQSVPQAGLVLANTLLDLYSAPPAEGFVERLRSECKEVLNSTPEGYWTKDAASKLIFLDSTIRESMRHSDFGSLAIPRRVVDPNGYEMDGGIKVPKGVLMEVPMHYIHMDESFYPDPSRFDPFRFAGTTCVSDDQRTSQFRGQKPVVALDDTFLTFGHGRNGCPGRFFGVQIMKTMLAYILEHYDIEHMPQRPPIVQLMEFRFPSESTTIRIRRRRDYS